MPACRRRAQRRGSPVADQQALAADRDGHRPLADVLPAARTGADLPRRSWGVTAGAWLRASLGRTSRCAGPPCERLPLAVSPVRCYLGLLSTSCRTLVSTHRTLAGISSAVAGHLEGLAVAVPG